MGRKGAGVEVRETSIRLIFVYAGKEHRKTLYAADGVILKPTPAHIKYAHRLSAEIRDKIRYAAFSMAEYFPGAEASTGEVLTVARQLDTWLASQRVEVSTRVGFTSITNFWRKTIGDKPLRGLLHSDILAALATVPSLSGKTINNRVSVLKSALDLAVLDKLLTVNPVAGLSRAKQQKAPLEPFDAGESARILTAVQRRNPGPLADMLLFWFRTGLRTSELFGLRWADVDQVRGVALIRGARVAGVDKVTTKTNKAREVRLDAQALDALSRQAAHTRTAGGHVWLDTLTGKPWANTQAFSRRVWVPLLKLSQVTYRRPYNIRHTRATEMLMAGINPAFAARQLGHDINVYLTVYAKWISGADDAAEMAKLSGVLAAIPTTKTP